MKFFTVTLIALLASIDAVQASTNCRYLPGDPLWPSKFEWNLLNKTLGGRLIATEPPLAHVCHDPTYDEAKCQEYRTQWQFAPIHFEDPASVMAPFFANQSCDPFTDRAKPCTLGNYVTYSVNATKAEHVVAAVSFARARNLRFVIRNTGHDYNGRSTGAGALSVWTHNMKSSEIIDYSDPYYTGKAIKVGAGVQGFEAMATAKAKGLVALGGECPTVGIAGGYTQGGGHSALTTSFGLAADSTLSFEVVTGDGRVITASRTKNSDLYWALSGGGGGTYGVVISMTSKVYPDAKVGGASVVFYAAEQSSADNFYKAIESFHSLLPAMVDAGHLVIYYFNDAFFQIAPTTAYNKSKAQVENDLVPFITAITQLGIKHTVSYNEAPNYTEHYDKYFGPLPFGNIQVGIAQYGGRLIPRDTITTNNVAFNKVARNITQDGVIFIGVATNVAPFASNAANAVLPAWRKTLVHATLTTPWSFTAPWTDMIALQDKMTKSIMPQIESVTKGSGVYMNEANFQQPDWQQEFFGSNYGKLNTIKEKYDPSHVLWSLNTVGSEYWKVASNGRMCRA